MKNFEAYSDNQVKIFDYALLLLGLIFLVFGFKSFSFALEDLTVTIFLLVVVCLAEFFKIELTSRDELLFAHGSINPRDGLIFAAVLLVQWQFLTYSNALVALILGVLFGHLIRAANLSEGFMTEVASTPVVFYFSLAVFSFFDKRIGETFSARGGEITTLKILPIALGVAFFIILRVGLDGIRAFFKTHTPARWFWVESIKLQIPAKLAFASVGVLSVFSYKTLLYQNKFPLSIVLALLLMLGLLYLYKLDINVKEAYRAAVKTLAGAVEVQNPGASGHGQRVAGYALAIARELNIHGQKYEDLGYSAQVHDIGRVGINEDSLDAVLESAAASEGEFLHAQLGAEIVGRVGFLNANAETVKMHHKPFSSHKTTIREAGTIPLAARIINVADTFDQLVDVKPMEERMTLEEAANRLKKESGLLLDPKIVRIFLALLRNKGLLSEGSLRRRR